MHRLALPVLLLLITLVGCRACDADPASEAYLQALRLMKGSAASPDEIAALLDRAVSLSPNVPAYRRTRGTFRFGRGRYEEALADALKAAELEGPKSSYPLYSAGLAEGALGNLDGALAHFQEAARRQPVNGQYYAGIALVHLERGQLEDALAAIEKASSIEPRFQAWHYARGFVLARMNKHEDAVREFGAAVAFSRALPGGGIEDVHFDGEAEFQRVRGFGATELRGLWFSGGRWTR